MSKFFKQLFCGFSGHWFELLIIDMGWKAKTGRCNFCGKIKPFKEFSSSDELYNHLTKCK